MRARFNLAYVHTQLQEYPAALGRLAEAFALDRTGEYRERLLQKQQEVLALLARRHQQEYLLLTNLVSKAAAPDGQTRRDADQVSPIVAERRDV